ARLRRALQVLLFDVDHRRGLAVPVLAGTDARDLHRDLDALVLVVGLERPGVADGERDGLVAASGRSAGGDLRFGGRRCRGEEEEEDGGQRHDRSVHVGSPRNPRSILKNGSGASRYGTWPEPVTVSKRAPIRSAIGRKRDGSIGSASPWMKRV